MSETENNDSVLRANAELKKWLVEERQKTAQLQEQATKDAAQIATLQKAMSEVTAALSGLNDNLATIESENVTLKSELAGLRKRLEVEKGQ